MNPQANELPLASLRVRLISMIYEGLIITAVLFAATAIFSIAFPDSQAEPLRTALRAYLLVVAGSYFVWSWTGGRRTLPMRTWRLSIVDKSGAPPSLARATIRYLVAAATIPLVGVGLLWVVVDRERAFLHDRVAGTRLVRDRAAPGTHSQQPAG